MMRRLGLGLIVLVGLCLGNVDQDTVDRVVSALQSGLRAPAARHRAAAVLAAMGARADAGTADMQISWAGPDSASLRNRALGPAYRLIELNGGEEVGFDQIFLAGQRAHAAITDPGNGNFVLAIHDDTGQPTCTAGTRNCSWMPLWTARFHIAVRNQSGRRGRIFLVLQ